MIRRPDVGWVLAELAADGRLGAGAEAAAEAALVAHAAEGRESPWVIRALVGAGAWLSALLLGVFLAMMDLGEAPQGYVVGALAVGGGFLLRRSAAPGSVFRSQIALCLSLAGHGLLWVLWVDAFDETGTWLAMALLAASLVYFPDAVHRFASAVGLCVAPLVLLGVFEGPAAAGWAAALGLGLTAALWGELRWQRSRWAELHLPVMFAVAGSLAGLLVLPPRDAAVSWGVTATLAAALCAVVVAVGRAVGAGARAVGLAVGAVVVVAALTGSVPGVVAAALALALAVWRGHPVLFGGAVVAFVAFVSQYYYLLAVPLMVKAGALLGAGLVLLAVRFVAAREVRA